jgi:hypothetical protein
MKREQRGVESARWIEDSFLVGDSLADSLQFHECTHEQKYVVKLTNKLLKNQLKLMQTEIRYFR